MATSQLVALGLNHAQIHYRMATGHLHRLHRGVYAVGHRKLTREGNWMAAVLAYGPDAVLSHRSAAALWEIGTPATKIDVTTTDTRHSRKRITAHCAPLHPEDRAKRDNLPVTSVARTILDLAAILDDDRLTRSIEDAERAGALNLRKLERAMARRPRAPGIKRLRRVLADYAGAADTRSSHERHFRKLVRKAGLPEPQFNVLVAGILVDAYWPSWRLVVEIDTRPFHTSPRAFERDRIRDAELQKAGFLVLRITEKRLYKEPAAVIADIVALGPNRVALDPDRG